ncbi:MAG: AraC family transcriptional regulator [Pseudomonadota bacterium]
MSGVDLIQLLRKALKERCLQGSGPISQISLSRESVAAFSGVNYPDFLTELAKLSASGDIGNCLRLDIAQGGSVDYYLFGGGLCLVVIKNATFARTSFSMANYCVVKVRLEGGLVETVESGQHATVGAHCHLVTSGEHQFSWRLGASESESLTTVNVLFKPESLRHSLAPSLGATLARLAESGEANEPLAHFLDVPVNSDILMCAQGILALSSDSPVRYLRANSMAIGLLADVLMQFESDDEKPDFNVRLRKDDVRRLCKVRDLIEVEFANCLTLESLASHGGLNRRKLTEGFKALFGYTVNDYLTLKRMCKAQELLKAGYSVGIAAESVGYMHQANFSKAFKRFYGISPKDLKHA